MDTETELLSRLAANHLHLAQFEPLRATLLALRNRNPDLARAILQAIVARAGRSDDILWSASCPSPSLLTHLSTIELLQFNNPTSSTWSFDVDTLLLRAEYLLLIHMLIDRVVRSRRNDIDLDSFEKEKEKDVLNESESFDEKVDLLNKNEDLGDGDNEFGDCVRVLDRFMELGVKMLKPDVNSNVNGDVKDGIDGNGNVLIEEGELTCLRKVIFEHSDVFEALCWNIQKQMNGLEGFDSTRAIVCTDEKARGEEQNRRVLGLMQKTVQLAHLAAMKDRMNEFDVEGAISRIRFLHIDYGVEEAEYR